MALITEEEIQALIDTRDGVAALINSIRDRRGKPIPIYEHRDDAGARGKRTGAPYITVDLVGMQHSEAVGKWRGLVRVRVYSRPVGADVRHDAVRVWAALYASSEHIIPDEIGIGAVDDYRAAEVDERGRPAVATEFMVQPAY